MARTRHWTYAEERVRRDVLVRDNYECQLRLPGCLVVATTVDHIHPKTAGGLAIPSNLQAACKPCNQRKGSRFDVVPVFKHGGTLQRPLREISPQDSRWAVETADFSRSSAE